jgi:hypothetical protein
MKLAVIGQLWAKLVGSVLLAGGLGLGVVLILNWCTKPVLNWFSNHPVVLAVALVLALTGTLAWGLAKEDPRSWD